MNASTTRFLAAAIFSGLIGLLAFSASAQTVIRLDDFSVSNGFYEETSTNSPGGPWSYSTVNGSWSCFDLDDCPGNAYRASRLTSPPVNVSLSQAFLAVSFTHRHSFEDDGSTRWDGGALFISVNGADFEQVDSTNFTANGYTGVVGGSSTPNNDLAGKSAFTGDSDGYDIRNFITSRAILGRFEPTDTVVIQFMAAWDDCAQGSEPNWEITRVQFTEELQSAPVIITQPVGTNILQAETFTLTCVAEAVPPPNYQWFKDGFPLIGRRGSSLTITNADPDDDSGQYFCRVVNSVGFVDSDTVTVTVTPDTFPPEIVAGVVQFDRAVKISFDEQAILNDSFGFLVVQESDPNYFAQCNIAVESQGTNIVLQSFVDPNTFEPITLTPGVNYQILVFPDAVQDIYGNLFAGLDTPYPLASEILLLSIDDNPRWKYFFNASVDLITNSIPPFNDPAFDDGTWASGAALLGTETATIPDDDGNPIPIRTTIPNNIITRYYRTELNLPVAAADIQSLQMRTVVDDGVVVYLNGTEIIRLGVPEDQNGSTAANRTVGDAVLEGPFEIPTDLLVDGVNVIAADLHQVNTTSSDNVWGLEAKAIVSQLSQDPPVILQQPVSPPTLNERDAFALTVQAGGTPPFDYVWLKDGVEIPGATGPAYAVASAQPNDNGSYTVTVTNPFGTVTSDPATVEVLPDTVAPELVTAVATLALDTIVLSFSEAILPATATDTAHYTVALRTGGGELAISQAVQSANGTTVTLTTANRIPEENYTLTVQDLVDLASTPNSISPNPTVVNLPTQVILLDALDFEEWSYNDTGTSLDGSGWQTSNYPDAATWATGYPSFYNRLPGDGSADGNLEEPLRTRVSLTNILGARIITYYYRGTLQVEDPTMELAFQYLLDDGAVFYINGQEVLRHNMPNGTISYDSLAPSAAGTDLTYGSPVSFDQSPVVAGSNLIAVEVHQQSSTSSDIGFALRLIGTVGTQTPRLRISQVSLVNNEIIITHNGEAANVSAYVQEATALDGPNGGNTSWSTRSGGPHASPYNAGAATGTRFFRLTDTP